MRKGELNVATEYDLPSRISFAPFSHPADDLSNRNLKVRPIESRI